MRIYTQNFDRTNGGFGQAPKFPSAHNLLFLMHYYEKTNSASAMEMVEKMLYDNALLIMAYVKAYELSHNTLYLDIAERTAAYILKEMTSPNGGFYSAQDADSEGREGIYYLFEPSEIQSILGKENGCEFCKDFDITDKGNFEGKNIPNLLKTTHPTTKYRPLFPKLYEYRKERYHLHLDDKILTSWNGLMIAAMCHLYRVTKNENYLNAAKCAQTFIENELCEDDTLYVSWREGQRSEKGFLDDYANEIFALLALYESTLDTRYLSRAKILCDKSLTLFSDKESTGFFLNSTENEKLIMRPKETYDGAMPSGNSMMAYNLFRLSQYYDNEDYISFSERQIQFMISESSNYPSGYAMFLVTLLDYVKLPIRITILLKDKKNLIGLPEKLPLNTIVKVFETPTPEYPLKNDQTTYYVCNDQSCLPASNSLPSVAQRGCHINERL